MHHNNGSQFSPSGPDVQPSATLQVGRRCCQRLPADETTVQSPKKSQLRRIWNFGY